MPDWAPSDWRLALTERLRWVRSAIGKATHQKDPERGEDVVLIRCERSNSDIGRGELA
jgi:hypothetical protein